MGQYIIISINDFKFCKRNGLSCFGYYLKLFFFLPVQHVFLWGCHADPRACFRHSVCCMNLYTEIHCSLSQTLWKLRTADDYFPVGEICLVYSRTVYDHLKNRRNTMGKSNLFVFNQVQNPFRLILPRINLLYAKQSRNIGKPPCVDVEHWCQRHIDIIRPEAP